MIGYTTSGDTHSTEAFLARMTQGDLYSNVEALAQEGVNALRGATPQDTGLTADSWAYEVEIEGGSATIWWTNDNVNNGFNVAVGIQYGHGTGTGGWIQGYDFINPALRPVFDHIADAVWKEVQKA